LRLFSFGGYGLALAALALAVFGAYDSYPYLANEKLNIFLNEDVCGTGYTSHRWSVVVLRSKFPGDR